jgi:hypothetical protein
MFRGFQFSKSTSCEEEELSPSIFVKRPRWFMQTLRDAQECIEIPRSIFRESRPSMKFPNFVVLMSIIIDSESSSVHEATNQQGWWDAMVHDDVWKIVSRPKG